MSWFNTHRNLVTQAGQQREMASNSIQSHSVTVEADDDDDDLVAIRHDQLLPNLPIAPDPNSSIGSQSISSSSKPTPPSRAAAAATTTRQNLGGIVTENRYVTSTSSLNTLDERVTETIMRDLIAIGNKMILILYPAGSSSSKSLLRDWDLWGPLVACLSLAVILSLGAPPDQSLSVFTGVFVIVWFGSLIVTLNASLLGGKVSLFQSICVLGYCLFPITMASFISLFSKWLIIRILLSSLGWIWSVWGAMNFFSGTRLEDGRALLAVYPLGLMYAILAYMTMLS